MTSAPETDNFVLDESVSHLLHRAQQLAADHFAKLAAGHDVTLRQFAVLTAINERPELSQSELVRITSIDRSTLADMVLRMESRGWIKRAASKKDGRKRALKLAPAGVKLMELVREHALEADRALMRELPRGKRKALLDRLSRLSVAAEKRFKLEARQKRRSAKAEALGKKSGARSPVGG